MKLFDYYVSLRLFQKNNNLPEEMRVSIRELAEALCCTERNVKLLLKKMSELNLLVWQPGRGRGNTSTLTFKNDMKTSIVEGFRQMLENGELTHAIELMKESLPEDVREELQHLLTIHFGYQEKEEEAAKDVLRIPMTRALSSLDPVFVSVSSESHFARQIYDTLLVFDEEQNTFSPHLAHDFDVSHDGKVITFFLRKGVAFHNGKLMTSSDVRYSFNRLTNQHVKSPSKWQTSLVEKVTCYGPYVIEFRLKRKTRMFLHFISSISMAVQPEDGSELIGTGPFSVTAFKEDVLILDVFTNYFKERAWLDRIEIWKIPTNARVEQHYELPDFQKEQAKKAVDLLQVGCNYVAFNLNKKNIVQNQQFREAVHQLFDANQIIKELGHERKLAATSLFPEKSVKKPPEEKSMELAKKALIASGYKGEPLIVSYFNANCSVGDAAWLKERALNIGLNLILHPFPITDYYKEEVTKNTDMIIMGEMFESNVVLAFISFFKQEASFVNRFLAGEEEKHVQNLIDRLMDEEEENEQITIMDEIEIYLYKKRLVIYTYHTYKKKSFPSSLKNVSMNTFGWADFRKLWVKPVVQEKIVGIGQ